MIDLLHLRQGHDAIGIHGNREDDRRVREVAGVRGPRRADDSVADHEQVDRLVVALEARILRGDRERVAAGGAASGAVGARRHRGAAEHAAEVRGGDVGIAREPDRLRVVGRQDDVRVRPGRDGDGRRVVVDVDVERAERDVAVLVGDGVGDRENGIVLVAAVRMDDRIVLGDGESAGVRIDRDREHGDGRRAARLDLLDEERAAEVDGEAEVAALRQRAGRVQRPGQIAVAARTGKAAGLAIVSDRVGIVVADAVGVAVPARNDVVVELHGDRSGLRLLVDELADILELGLRESELGRRDEVAQGNARIERRNDFGEIAAAALQLAGRRLGLGFDEERREVRRRHLHVADDELRDEDRAARNHHLRPIRHVDDEVAAVDGNVGHLDARRQRDHARNRHRRRRGGELADVDRQGRRGFGPVRIGKGVTEDVLDSVGGARVAHVAVVALGIHRQDAVLADRLEASRPAGGGAARALDLDDRRRSIAGRIGAGRAGQGARAGNRVPALGTVGAGRKSIDVRPCNRRGIGGHGVGLGSVIVAHKPPLSWPGPRARRGRGSKSQRACCGRVTH